MKVSCTRPVSIETIRRNTLRNTKSFYLNNFAFSNYAKQEAYFPFSIVLSEVVLI